MTKRKGTKRQWLGNANPTKTGRVNSCTPQGKGCMREKLVYSGLWTTWGYAQVLGVNRTVGRGAGFQTVEKKRHFGCKAYPWLTGQNNGKGGACSCAHEVHTDTPWMCGRKGNFFWKHWSYYPHLTVYRYAIRNKNLKGFTIITTNWWNIKVVSQLESLCRKG